MGVVLSRPSSVTVGEAVPQLEDSVPVSAPVFVGGPVQPGAIVYLAEFQDPADAGLLVMGRIGFPASDANLDDLADVTDRGRVFAGYAGWESGQLEQELAEGAWYVLQADPEDALTSEPGGLWRFVLRRQGGQLALVSNFPPDPTMN